MSEHATQLYPRRSLSKAAHVSGMAAYEKLVAEAEADYEATGRASPASS
jgi:acetyl-CoA synthetase